MKSLGLMLCALLVCPGLACSLTGCAALMQGNSPTPPTSVDALNPATSKELAISAADRIATLYPGSDIYLEKDGAFGTTLAYALEAKGMMAQTPSRALTLTYNLDHLDEFTGYLSMEFSDGRRMSQTFDLPAQAPGWSRPESDVAPVVIAALPTSPAPAPRPQLPEYAPETLSENPVSTPGPGTASDSEPQEPASPARATTPVRTAAAARSPETLAAIHANVYPQLNSAYAAPLQSASSPITIPAALPLVAAGPTDSAIQEIRATPASPSVTPAVAPALAIIASPSSATSWTINPGSLADQLADWCERAGWKLVWKAESDVNMHTTATLRGSFESVVENLFQGLHVQGNALRGTLYRGNHVLEVVEN